MQNRYKFKLERFYKLFDIKPIQLDYPDNIDEIYPEITDEMYMKLLSLNIEYWRSDYVLKSIGQANLKSEILSDCCYLIDELIKSPEKNKIIKTVQKIVEKEK